MTNKHDYADFANAKRAPGARFASGVVRPRSDRSNGGRYPARKAQG
jgi:hypothetical protein